MKQLFYLVAIVILMIIANRLMKKVKDPEELSDLSEQGYEEDFSEEEFDPESPDYELEEEETNEKKDSGVKSSDDPLRK